MNFAKFIRPSLDSPRSIADNAAKLQCEAAQNFVIGIMNHLMNQTLTAPLCDTPALTSASDPRWYGFTFSFYRIATGAGGATV